MGWKKTMSITKSDAQKEVLSKLFEASPEMLGYVLDTLFDRSSYNFTVVPFYDPYNALNYDTFKAEGGLL